MDMHDDKLIQAIEEWKMGPGSSSMRLAGERFMPEKRHMALKSSWRTEPMPYESATTVRLGIPIEEDELRQLAMGHIPEMMEDHWFMYFDGEFIRYYRSWTGFCLYMAKVVCDSRGPLIDFLVINRDEAQYRETDDAKDVLWFTNLVAADLGLSGGEVLIKRMLDYAKELKFEGYLPDELAGSRYEEGIEKGSLKGSIDYFCLLFEGQGHDPSEFYFHRNPNTGKLDVQYALIDGSTTLDSDYADKRLSSIRDVLNAGIGDACWRHACDGERFAWSLVVVCDGVCHQARGENVVPQQIREVACLINELASDAGMECKGEIVQSPLAYVGQKMTR